jgi:lipid A 4'-phosphatase
MGQLKTRWVMISFVLACLAFTVFSQADLSVSAQFYQPGEGFFLRRHPLVLFLYKLVPAMVDILVPSLVVPLLLGLIIDRPWLHRHRKAFAYLLMTLILGPGLLVNTVFKNNWGRARPVEVHEFGGDKIFTAALVPSNQCPSNCAFVSGHASMGFYLLSLSFLIKRQRRLWLLLGLNLGGLIGLARIMQGRHYLSDVIFSFFVIYFSAWLTYELIFRRLTLFDCGKPSGPIQAPIRQGPADDAPSEANPSGGNCGA